MKIKKVTKKLQKFIDLISVVRDSTISGDKGVIYYSKVDGSYLTRVGMENDLSYLMKRGITEQISDGENGDCSACIGFNPTEQKWYGWSHRALFGFGIGGKCKQGDCGYNANNKENFMKSCLDFWGGIEYSLGDNKAEFTKGLDYTGKMVDGVLVSYTYNDKVPNEKLRGTIYSNFSQFPDKWGKGEWTTKTIKDAKLMAIDFAMGVS